MENKILIVSANKFQDPYPVYPLGVSYLHTYLSDKLREYSISIFDFNLSSIEQFALQLEQGNYRYVCVSLRNVDDVNIFSKNSFIEWYRTVVDCIRRNSKAKMVIGGAGFSIFPRQIFESLNVDYAIHGEGEQTLLKLIESLDNGQDLSCIEGLLYKDNDNETRINPRTKYLDSVVLGVSESLAQYYWQQSGMLNIQTKRGCPHKCIYCSYPAIEGRTVRTLDADVVVENIKRLVGKGMDYLFFTDSVFNIDIEYNRVLAEKIIRSGVKLRWGAYFSPRGLCREELELYKRSGLTHVEFGSESFSDTQLDNYRKGFGFEDVLRASNDCLDLGIFYAHFLILGGWGETIGTLKETFRNSRHIEHSVFFPYLGMRVYPRTRLCELIIKEGIIRSEADLIDPYYYLASGITAETVKKLARQSGGEWFFSDDTTSSVMGELRKRGRKGPLWEYLRY